jgi:hypothetical protein
MKINSIGTFTPATTFVPLFQQQPKEFKPLVIRRIDHEITETETQESTGSAVPETQSRIAPQDQQTNASEIEQADP